MKWFEKCVGPIVDFQPNEQDLEITPSDTPEAPKTKSAMEVYEAWLKLNPEENSTGIKSAQELTDILKDRVATLREQLSGHNCTGTLSDLLKTQLKKISKTKKKEEAMELMNAIIANAEEEIARIGIYQMLITSGCIKEDDSLCPNITQKPLNG